MPDPSSPDDTLHLRPRNGTSAPNGNGAWRPAPPPGSDTYAPPPPPEKRGGPGFLPAFLGTLAALLVVGLIAFGIWYAMTASSGSGGTAKGTIAGVSSTTTPTPSAPTAEPTAVPASAPTSNVGAAIDNPAAWKLGEEPAQPLTADAASDIGWWTRTFYLPSADKVSDYLKEQGLDVSRVTPIHYEDAKDSRTITYQVFAQVPKALYTVPKATWAPSDPDLKPLASVVVLNHDVAAGQFWNTASQTVAEPAGSNLDFAWKVSWDKNTNVVTTDRLPYTNDVFTEPQVAQFASETDNTVGLLRAQVQSINAKVAADTQTKLAAVPADPAKPELMSTHWNHGDGSGEPTKSAERMGGATAGGAAGGAGFGAIAGDAGMGAGIGAGVGLLGGFIYDTVSKNNDRHRYEAHAEAVNDQRISAWRSQVKALQKQRDEIKKDAANEKQQLLQELASRINAAGGHVENLPAAVDTPQAQTPATYSDAPQVQVPADAPSGPITKP